MYGPQLFTPLNLISRPVLLYQLNTRLVPGCIARTRCPTPLLQYMARSTIVRLYRRSSLAYHPPVLGTVSLSGFSPYAVYSLLSVRPPLFRPWARANIFEATGVSVMSISLQLKNYRKPSLQRAVVRIMVMLVHPSTYSSYTPARLVLNRGLTARSQGTSIRHFLIDCPLLPRSRVLHRRRP